MSDTLPLAEITAGALDFTGAKPNNLAEYFRQEGVRQLDEDVRDAFPDSDSVNAAFRLLMRVAKQTGRNELPGHTDGAELPKAS